MPDNRGGYRKPANPAPASGPGALSKRTDGKQPVMDLPNPDYGEGQTFRDLESAAPMAQSNPGAAAAPSGAGGQAGPSVIPMGAGTQMPNVPVTDGAPLGPGAGPEALGMSPDPQRTQDYAALQDSLPFLQWKANQPGSSWAARNLVRKLMAGGAPGGQQ